MLYNFNTTGLPDDLIPDTKVPDESVRLLAVEALADMHSRFETPGEWLGFVDRVVEYIKCGYSAGQSG